MLTINPLPISQPLEDAPDYESLDGKLNNINAYIEDEINPDTGESALSLIEKELRRQLRVIRDSAINEADYNATLGYTEAERDITAGFAKRGFSRRPDLINRAIRLETEKYAAAIKQAYVAAYDLINQIILQRYEIGVANQFEYTLTNFNQLKIGIDTATKEQKLAINSAFAAYIEKLDLENKLDSANIEQMYKFLVQEINAQATTDQRLEQISQDFQTDTAALEINLGSDQAIQALDLTAEADAKQISFAFDKDARTITNQANIDASIAEANASNEFAVKEMDARISGALQKQAARLQAATNENAAKVLNLTDLADTRLNITYATNTARLDAANLINGKKVDAYIKLANARLLNMASENTAEVAALSGRSTASLSARQLTQATRLDSLEMSNAARISNLIAKANNDLSLQQTALTAKLDNLANEQAVSLSAINDLNTAQQAATTTKVISAETRATNRAAVTRDVSVLRNESRYANLLSKINALAANRQLTNSAELAALVTEFSARLDAIQIKGQGRLNSNQVVSLAQLANDIAIANATLQSRQDVGAATLQARQKDVSSNSQAANIRLLAQSVSGIISEATSAQNRMATAATQENIDLFNAYNASQIAIANTVQDSTTYHVNAN